MLNSEVVQFVEELESLGVKFTVIPLLGGTLRLNCWRLQNSWINREQINRRLVDQIENSPENAAQVAAFINGRSTAAVRDSNPQMSN